jgi:hypothetical protein
VAAKLFLIVVAQEMKDIALKITLGEFYQMEEKLWLIIIEIKENQ